MNEGRNSLRRMVGMQRVFLQNMFIIWFIQKKAISLSCNKLTF